MFRESHRAILQQKLETAFTQHPEHFRPLLPQPLAKHSPFASETSRIKRLLERWCADREFRKALRDDPAGATARYGLDVDPEEIRYLWDEGFARKMLAEHGRAPMPVQRYRLWNTEKLLHREHLRLEGCAPSDPRHRVWRERQVNRTRTHLGPAAHVSIVHAPFTLELSDGCSVGCWFCGVSADRKRGDFLYTRENQKLWREALTVLRRLVGPAAAAGFCYWATDPLDNPDYEKFMIDFAEICGKFPQTTTAQPQKDIERTRALLTLSAEKGCEINRFSILNLRIFEQVMEAFTPEELLHCELVLQNREANQMQGNSGRARGSRQLRRRAEEAGRVPPGWETAPGTISCVSGFLLNMVRHSVRLITPCPSSERWPNGHWLYEEGHFSDARDLEELLEGMMRRHMRTALRAGDPARLRPDLTLELRENGFVVVGYGSAVTYHGIPFAREIGAALVEGDCTVGEIALELEDRIGCPAANTVDFLNEVFQQGLLDEEPVTGVEDVARS